MLSKKAEQPSHVCVKGHRQRANRLPFIHSKQKTEQLIHWNKITNIQRQLASGNYNINERINLVLDRILEDLMQRRDQQ